jgi:hypothetical protein
LKIFWKFDEIPGVAEMTDEELRRAKANARLQIYRVPDTYLALALAIFCMAILASALGHSILGYFLGGAVAAWIYTVRLFHIIHSHALLKSPPSDK